MNITEPLRLATGSHKAGSGKGCAMNVESWINGDKIITDMPECADRVLSCVVQNVNDNYCTHRDGDLLCAPCSIKVLELAARTRGTALDNLSKDEQRRVWALLALDEAESVASPDEGVKTKERNMKMEDVTYSKVAFAAIEIKGVVFFVTAEFAKAAKAGLTEQLMHSSVEGPVLDGLMDMSEFVIDMNTGLVLKPKSNTA